MSQRKVGPLGVFALTIGCACAVLLDLHFVSAANLYDCTNPSTSWGQTCGSVGAQNCVSSLNTCEIDPWVCPDGSCGPNGQECSRAVYTAQKQYNTCAHSELGNSCTNCEKYYCASFQMYTGYDQQTHECLNPKCTGVFYRSNVCVPPPYNYLLRS